MLTDNVNYLLTCSELSRDAFVLAKLDLAARLRKQIGQLLNEWIEAESQAYLGEIIREVKRVTVTVTDTEPQLPDILPSRRLQHRP